VQPGLTSSRTGQDPPEHPGGAGDRFGLQAELLHDHQVAVHRGPGQQPLRDDDANMGEDPDFDDPREMRRRLPRLSAIFLPAIFLPGDFLPGDFLPGDFLPGDFLPGDARPPRRLLAP
jgi:hypothetical protein